jgi:hypothetical protein
MSSKQPIHLADDRNPWDRQPGESNRQYSRFRAFMELGRARTLKQAVEMLRGVGDDKVSYRTLMQYAYEYRWTERAEAHDRDQDRLERERMLTLRRGMYARHRKLAAGLTAKAVARLQSLQAADLTALDVTRFIVTATKLERTALGEPEQTVGVVGAGGGPVEIADFTNVPAEERKARLEVIVQELARRAATNAPADEDDD